MQKKKTEDRIMADFHQWLNTNFPWTTGLAYHVPNESEDGDRARIARNAAKGVVPGMPDYHIEVSSEKFSKLVIEFKTETGTVSENQKHVMERFTKAGRKCVVCRSLEEAKKEWVDYLVGVSAQTIEALAWQWKTY